MTYKNNAQIDGGQQSAANIITIWHINTVQTSYRDSLH